MTAAQLWDRYRRYLCRCDELGLSLDISRMRFEDDFFDRMAPSMAKAYADMKALESGAIANPDEQRMVGHYWLRAPELAPSPEIRAAIEEAVVSIKTFVNEIHAGERRPEREALFTDVLLIGIGGSALGPQFIADALGEPRLDRMNMHFFDNTDPDGMDRVLQRIGERLSSTLCLIISKSGGTAETRNGMLVARKAYEDQGLSFAAHSVAITGAGSKLDKLASEEQWLARFPMWDWVGGRTSVMAAVGLLPAALQGIDIDELLEGAALCDRYTRSEDTFANPAALLALMWHFGCDGKGSKDMVLLPYKDRLVLFSRYLQQLIMESLGKAEDLDGERVEQGITVYGNKGSTDQHAYVQQLRDGVRNFFVTFVDVIQSGGEMVEVEPGVTSGDYLHGFLLGTRQALYESGRDSMTLSIDIVDEKRVGALIALFERAVGFYASLVNINAYHQPGVEAGKKAAAAVLSLRSRILDELGKSAQPRTAEQLAESLGALDQIELIHKQLEYLSANYPGVVAEAGSTPFDAAYSRV
ncbi:MAG: glucose-6-phosphate isomerase [Myxococcota bacterium]|jgi:glucose-6-phosphate isomerase|nr:glucose-6-phosphate isomerase [Myxococcota bacterium]